jgi:hypothetical protein
MTRRILALGLVVSALFLGSLGFSAANHSVPLAYADESVQVYPVAGSQYDQFVFTGKGFGRGAVLTETYTDPSGDDYSFFDSYGKESLIQAGDDGTWQVTVKPFTDFEGAYAGTWHVSFCLVNTSDCWSGDITITL